MIRPKKKVASSEFIAWPNQGQISVRGSTSFKRYVVVNWRRLNQKIRCLQKKKKREEKRFPTPSNACLSPAAIYFGMNETYGAAGHPFCPGKVYL
ncbi:hypothetical protein BaRGS_00004665 [Batillaria attramentaria]|uniref:Uncharacterized protein n=1 Tax=Batillaria attramentaria TaxID=370345 RepID=A0ABD0LWZ0_9CAEN